MPLFCVTVRTKWVNICRVFKQCRLILSILENISLITVSKSDLLTCDPLLRHIWKIYHFFTARSPCTCTNKIYALSWVLFPSRSSAKVRAVLAENTSGCREPRVWDDKWWAEPAINHSCQTKEKAVYKFLQGDPLLHYLNQHYFMLCFASFRISFWNIFLKQSCSSDLL